MYGARAPRETLEMHMSRLRAVYVLPVCRLNDARRLLRPWRYEGTARVQRHQLAAPHTDMCVPALQEWLPVEELPELVAALETPLPPGADGAERPRSRRRVGD
jgi:hypothetical protein